MTIEEFVKSIDFPEMEILGKMQNFNYYIEKNPNPDSDDGLPIVIAENKITQEFEVCDSDRALDVIAYFK